MSTTRRRVTDETGASSRVARGDGRSRRDSIDERRARLIGRLRTRVIEIERVMLGSVQAVGGPPGVQNEEFEAGTRAAIAAGANYCLTGFEYGPGWVAPVPPGVLEHVRRAARYGMSTETTVRRLLTGSRSFAQAVASEGAWVGLPPHAPAMLELRNIQDELIFEHWVPAYTAYHAHERDQMMRSPEQRRLELVQTLLTSHAADASELGYDLDRWHLGVIARGRGAKQGLTSVAARLGLDSLAVSCSERVEWAWLGAERALPLADIERLLPLDGISYAIGQPEYGRTGWRLTHEQAQAALKVALYRPQGITRCSDVSLEAAFLRDEGLRRSLFESYLLPLSELRIGDDAARETLRAWIDCQRNVSSAAFRLGVTRHTVERRLRHIEAALGRPLATCMAELEVALRLQAITGEPRS